MSSTEPTTAEIEIIVPSGVTPDVQALLDAGFDEEAAQGIVTTADGAQPFVEAVMTDIDPKTLAARVALMFTLIDNTPSMRDLIALALAAHNRALDTVQRLTNQEPVDVLASASWLNGAEPVIYPYMLIKDAPRFNDDTSVRLTGMTAWYDRYAEALAATAAQMGGLEAVNKIVYGMAGLVTDGFDNDSALHTAGSLGRIVRGFRRTKVLVPYAVYTGEMPEVGTIEYNDERSKALRRLRLMDVDDVELETATLEVLVRRIFTAAGFDPSMVFLPGQDPAAIVAAFVTISKLMVSVSQGQMPEGLNNDI